MKTDEDQTTHEIARENFLLPAHPGAAYLFTVGNILRLPRGYPVFWVLHIVLFVSVEGSLFFSARFSVPCGVAFYQFYGV